MNNTTLNRRTWLKKSAIAAGGIFGATTLLSSEVFGKPAFGMIPYKGNLLLTEDYTAPVADIKARLSANENPWGPSKKAVAAIAESAGRGNRYMYSSAMKMVDLLASEEGVKGDNILMAAGSTDILEKTAFALCMKGGNVISADPSYMSLVRTATSIGATWKNIPLKPDYSHDLAAMEKAIDSETKLVYICNPNNPTGTLTSIDEIKSFCKRVSAKVPVFIDEAYLELLEDHKSQTAVSLVQEGYDVIICRTFSKIHGMAGLRMGYMVAKPERIKMIKTLVRTEMGICLTSLEGAMASVKDLEFQDFTRKSVKEGREYTFDVLKKAGFNPIPSYTNFILFPLQMPTKTLVDKMVESGISVRGFEISDKPYGRVSIGTMDEMKMFAKAITALS